MRVYYEDTDLSGVVYHANYLRYFERARTEWLRSLGYDATRLKQEHGLVMTVREVEINFRKPARIDDQLGVTVALAQVKRVYFVLEQEVRAGDEPIARARVQIVCVACEGFAPRPIPGFLLEKLGASVKNA